MKRLLMIAAVLVFPASALAQVPPPPVPRPAPAPRTAPMPPVPLVSPVAPAPLIAGLPEGYPGGLLAGFDQASARQAMERARIAMEDSRMHFDSMKWDMPVLHNFDFDMQDAFTLTTSSASAYESGLSLLSRRDYDKAILRFDQVISQKGTRADAATYHKAYVLYRLGRSSDANAALSTLK